MTQASGQRYREYLALDLETVKETPEGEDWRDHRPLGIACTAFHAPGQLRPKTWHSRNQDGSIADRTSTEDLRSLVKFLLRRSTPPDGRQTILTWNGLGFDFDILAEESGMQQECRDLARNHVDMMFHILCQQGYPASLSAAAEGMRLPGKTPGITGADVARLWAGANRPKVLEYCAQDVRVTLALAQACEKRQALHWTSRSGNFMTMPLDSGWMTVQDAMNTPHPDTSWMTNPIPRSDFPRWLQENRNP